MKQLKFILPFFALTILLSCKPTVTFNQPQPTDKNSLSEFPKRIQGQFQSLKDNSILNLNEKTISRIYDFDFKIHINQVDSNYILSGDTIINIKDNEKQIMRREGDTLLEHIHSVDTLFSISDNHVLKRFKGYCFLSFLHHTGNWEVKKLELHREQLSISGVSTKEDIGLLKQISESTLDSLPYHFKPTKRQFKRFIKAEGFSDVETFVRIK